MKTILLLISALFSLHAVDIVVSAEQEKDWHIVTQELNNSSITPEATLYVEVITPPKLLKILSLPNEVTISDLHVNLYDSVSKGDALVSVSSVQWLEAQKNAIASSIDYTNRFQIDQRKQMLCSEQIIAKKECIASQAALQEARNRLKAAKEMLSAYGASNTLIADITKKYKVYPTLTLYSSVKGHIIELSGGTGSSIEAFKPLVTILKDGDLWIEGALSTHNASLLKRGDTITLRIDTHQFESKVLNIAPFINTKNQTRNVRFSLPKDSGLLSGLRTSATLYLHVNSIKIPKKALIQEGKQNIIFVKTAQGYRSLNVNVLSQEDDYYYLKPQAELKQPVAVNSVLILKNMMDSSDE